MGCYCYPVGYTLLDKAEVAKVLVSGTVVDGDDNSPVMQATVQILALKDSSMVAGNVTDLDGRFSLSARPGKYLLKVSFVGYSPSFQPITLTSSKPRLNLGTISLHSDAVMLEGAVIVAQAPEVTAAEIHWYTIALHIVFRRVLHWKNWLRNCREQKLTMTVKLRSTERK